MEFMGLIDVVVKVGICIFDVYYEGTCDILLDHDRLG